MVDWYGSWIEEKDYNTYPKEKWCDMDYMAVWIRSTGYNPKIAMKDLILNILYYYDESDEVKEDGYFLIPDARSFPDNLMVNIEDVEEFVFMSGGLEQFDYWID